MWMVIHRRSQCVSMLQDPSPPEIRVGGKKGQWTPSYPTGGNVDDRKVKEAENIFGPL